jgi:hypothetical protein
MELRNFGKFFLSFCVWAGSIQLFLPILALASTSKTFNESFEHPSIYWDSSRASVSSEKKYQGFASLLMPAGSDFRLDLGSDEIKNSRSFPVLEARHNYRAFFYIRNEDSSEVSASQLRIEILGATELSIQATLGRALDGWTRVDLRFDTRNFSGAKNPTLVIRTLNQTAYLDEFTLESSPLDLKSWVQESSMETTPIPSLVIRIKSGQCIAASSIRISLRIVDINRRALLKLKRITARTAPGLMWQESLSSEGNEPIKELGILLCPSTQVLDSSSLQLEIPFEIQPAVDATSDRFQIEAQTIFQN